MFGHMLRNAMTTKGMTISDISAATGISRSSFYYYLSGRGEPRDNTKERIALSMGLERDYFINVLRAAGKSLNLPVETAALLMGKSQAFIKRGLQNGVFPWGYAVQMLDGKWSYYISPQKLSQCIACEIPDGMITESNTSIGE